MIFTIKICEKPIYVRLFPKYLSNCAEQETPPAAAHWEGVREFGEVEEASRRGRPELSDKLIESADSTDSLIPIRWLEFSYKKSKCIGCHALLHLIFSHQDLSCGEAVVLPRQLHLNVCHLVEEKGEMRMTRKGE